MFAASPAAPAAPLSQKSHFVAIFGSPVYFPGHTIIKMPRLHLSCESRRYAANGVRLPKGAAFGRAKIVCKKKSVIFPFFEYLFGATGSLFPSRAAERAGASIIRRSANTPPVTLSGAAKAKPKPRSRTGLLRSPLLSFRPRRRTPMLPAFCRMAKCSTCKAAPPLPKNLASLRFSGALFIDRVEKSCA